MKKIQRRLNSFAVTKQNTGNNPSKRIPYYDTLRLIAIFWVYTTHFIDFFHNDYFRFWSQGPTALILNGLSGKTAVVLFSVILGCFAYRNGGRGETAITPYIAKRYIFFFFCGLFINALYMLGGCIGVLNEDISLLKLIWVSINLGNDIFPTYWCIPAFFVGSIINFLNGRVKIGVTGIILEAAAFLLLGTPWVAICLMGSLAAHLMEHPGLNAWLEKRALRLVLFLVFFVLIKQPDSTLAYLIDALASVTLLLIIPHSTLLQRILNNRLISQIGQNCMAIFLLHGIVCQLLGVFLFTLPLGITYEFHFLLVWMICFVVIILISFPAMAVIRHGSNLIFLLINKFPRSSSEKSVDKSDPEPTTKHKTE